MDRNNLENIRLGEKLKKYRKAKGLTQEQLAETIDIDTKYLARLEKGFHNPTFNVMKKLAAALEFDLNKISDLSETKTPDKLYTKSLQILNSAQNDEEKKLYLEALQHTQKCLKRKE